MRKYCGTNRIIVDGNGIVVLTSSPPEAERRDIINLHIERNLLPRPSKETIDNLVYLGFAGSDLEGAVRDVPIRGWRKERAVPASGLAWDTDPSDRTASKRSIII